MTERTTKININSNNSTGTDTTTTASNNNNNDNYDKNSNDCIITPFRIILYLLYQETMYHLQY